MNKIIKTKQITSVNANDEQLKLLYQTAFPENEQIPWNDLIRLIDQMHLDFTAYYEDDNFIGFTILFPHKKFNWFWYFAVIPELRGQGKGQKILTYLIEKYKEKNVVLDMESPKQKCDNLEQRKRRHDFYLRNGFRDTNLYRKYGNLEMTIMINGKDSFTMQDWNNIVAELRKFWTWD
ncbi:MAG: GNAT family N-acetyltransferase [Elusimicrobia bacterium]|nr:GNAT family N-acetyltransferase [Elusimicrobiota bacterium]